MPELKNITIARNHIKFVTELNAGNHDPETDSQLITTTAKAQPLASFTKAFEALRPVFCTCMEIETVWDAGLSIDKMTISRTKHGTRSIKLRATKQLETRAGLLPKVETPFLQVDKPADGESGEIQIEPKSLKLVMKALHEAERYADGKRSQTMFDFDEAKKGLQALADTGKEDMFGT